MSTDQKYNCIFCKDVFQNKEELQVHFRKHADPRFKSKNRFESDPQEPNEKVKEKTEMVSCDVCEQTFPTISKAITHKHKVHPDHDVKYFCPWCGKLFTMKHPYNIHIQTSHEKHEQIEDKIFHCDCCDVDFFLPSAMVYHNRFFHRQDTDIPDIGMSKKLKLYNQEVIQLHYCSFCGEEYENKVNLYKHINDDHCDENQSPEEVLRCPLCEAIFFHLDAYEIHLSFHTTDDLYSANNELFAGLLDFSLETVPPIIEKVEPREDFDIEAQSQEADVDSTVNALGIEKFLELAMEQSEEDNVTGKVKKKKHKKSKKAAAITLDEFLSMNQDVFGEGLDFQGVEEVPTRVVAKQLKSKKSSNAAASAELEKLKQKGIVVMKVGSSRPSKSNTKKAANKPKPNRELKTSSEVLTKLMNQSNNQIKIVKKPNVIKTETAQNINNSKVGHITEKTVENNLDTNVTQAKTESEQNTEGQDPETKCTEPDDSAIAPTNTETPDKSATDSHLDEIPDKGNDPADNDDKDSNATTNMEYSEQACKTIANFAQKLNKNNNVKNTNRDMLEQNKIDDTEVNDKIESKGKERENIEESDEPSKEDEGSSKQNTSKQFSSPGPSSLTSLKHLSHLTVKPVIQNKTAVTIEKSSETTEETRHQIKNDKEISYPNVSSNSEVVSPLKSKPLLDEDPTLGALKGLSKNITIKSLAANTKGNIAEVETNDDNEPDSQVQNTTSKVKVKDITPTKNLQIKKIKVEHDDSPIGTKIMNVPNNIIKNMAPKIVNKSQATGSDTKTNKNSLDSPQSSPMKVNPNVLKHLPNITAKPISINKNVRCNENKLNNTTIKNIQSQKETEIIEISDLDDSDEEMNNKEHEPKPDTTKPNPLKNLSKHITVKSLNQQAPPFNKTIKTEKVEEYYSDEDDGNEDFNGEDEIPVTPKVCGQKLSNKNTAFKNVLKNLGKNITVKSRTSSPNPGLQSHDHNSQEFNVDDAHEKASDSDSDIGNVKITEIDADDLNDDDIDDQPNESNPIIESPHDSCSENEYVDDTDFEAEIKATTVQKSSHEVTTDENTKCFNNLKNISKSITIKSVNINSADKQDNSKPSQSQNSTEVNRNQNNQLAIKLPPHLVKESSNDNPFVNNRNVKKVGKIVDHTSNESLNQKVAVNKEVTVKTFQSKTVIQEITTTVTKTIKTVNQTVNKQETRNSSQMNIPVLPQKVIGMKPSTSKNLQGVVIRHAAPVLAKPSGPGSQVRPSSTVVRPSKQIVPLRPVMNVARPSAPRMPSARPKLPKSSPNKQVIGRPLKFSPSVIATSMVKRPNSEEVSGPFSCFKKPKESLIPVSDVPSFTSGDESMIQTASHTSTSNYMSTSKVVKGNAVVTATHTKSEVTSMQQSRLNNAIGVKVKNVKQTQVQEKCESSMKRTTLEAIERLQKSGLLVKKPRIDDANESCEDGQAEENEAYSSSEEHNE